MSKVETIKSTRSGKTEFRLVRKDLIFHGMMDGKVLVHGDDADDVWRRLHDEAGALNKRYFGYSGARNLFLYYYPEGFHSNVFSERPYKVAASERLCATVPLEAAVSGTGYGEDVLGVFRATDLLHPKFELPRVQELLRGGSADAFIQAAARFTLGEGKAALIDMERALKPHEAAKWTIATYLPFLWRPNEHMFLKPEATLDFAERVGHPFASAYGAAFEWRIYEQLLGLARRTSEEIADLKPRDMIDIQSLIWVISGAYAGEKPRTTASS